MTLLASENLTGRTLFYPQPGRWQVINLPATNMVNVDQPCRMFVTCYQSTYESKHVVAEKSFARKFDWCCRHSGVRGIRLVVLESSRGTNKIALASNRSNHNQSRSFTNGFRRTSFDGKCMDDDKRRS
jgi:hypothetical protein